MRFLFTATLLGGSLLCFNQALAEALPPAALQAQCSVSLPRASFADNVIEREPVGDGSDATERLWFYTEVADGGGEILYHQWYRNGEQDLRIRLPIGADSWRTWSNRRVEDGVRFTVRVLTESGCDLGEYGLLSNAPIKRSAANADVTVLNKAHSLLADGDITGARLQIRQAQEAGNKNPELQRFLEQDLALAELARDIAADNLYLAGGRLDALNQPAQKNKLSRPQRDALAELQQSWQQRRDQLQSEMSLRLMALQRSLAAMPASSPCHGEITDLDWLPEPERQQLMLVRTEHNDTLQTLTLLDQRTGFSHSLERPCWAKR